MRSPLLLAFLLLTLSNTSALAQRWQPGYLVLQRGDTLRGLLEAPTRSTVAFGVRFRKSATTPVQPRYLIKQVRGLRLDNGKAYVMRRMQPVMGGDTLCLLLEPLVQGRATLYRSGYDVFSHNPDEVYANSFSLIYYYLEPARTAARPPYLLSSRSFQANLTSAFRDCPSAPTVGGSFTEANLVRLVRAYNACSEPIKL